MAQNIQDDLNNTRNINNNNNNNKQQTKPASYQVPCVILQCSQVSFAGATL